MKCRFLLLALPALVLTACNAAAKRPDFSSYVKDDKAAVFVFLAPDCPLSQNYTLTLNQFHSEFQRRGTRFYGVVPGNRFQNNEVDAFAKKYSLAFPLLRDGDFTLADFLGAMTTPEAFVVSAAGETLYKGAIDNWASALGQHRQVITEHYLRDVLDGLLSGRVVPYRETRAVGCIIERES
ncbi:MAG: redoxin domain-containing protein [Acidobacteria bacterium]|nr:redoxin domain-containing protein [Acidobacteriota bacterium]